MSYKRILYTPGEPAGVGPELAVKIAQRSQDCEFIAICDPELLMHSAESLGLTISLHTFDPSHARRSSEGEISIIPVQCAAKVIPGNLDSRNSPYVLETLKKAASLCLSNDADALVTGPVQKSIINDSGIAFSGHTEFFAELSNVKKVVMMLATKNLRVALATTHIPLKDVASAITQESLSEVIQILISELKTKFGISHPKILICGLNPHAGENGHLGLEEIETINPVLDELRNSGAALIGPLPADTLFTPQYLQDTDAVLAMYHDQGLPVLKSQGFGEAVNITLGLPFIRTSVDHGTALNIAGKGIANTGSLETALGYAEKLVAASQSSE